MKPLEHTGKLLKECHDFQEHGHCIQNPPAWVIINDIEILINDLEEILKEKKNEP